MIEVQSFGQAFLYALLAVTVVCIVGGILLGLLTILDQYVEGAGGCLGVLIVVSIIIAWFLWYASGSPL